MVDHHYDPRFVGPIKNPTIARKRAIIVEDAFRQGAMGGERHDVDPRWRRVYNDAYDKGKALTDKRDKMLMGRERAGYIEFANLTDYIEYLKKELRRLAGG